MFSAVQTVHGVVLLGIFKIPVPQNVLCSEGNGICYELRIGSHRVLTKLSQRCWILLKGDS